MVFKVGVMMVDKNEYNLIKNSGLFFEEWFRLFYKLDDDVDPISYYLKKGVDLGLNPSPLFDTRWYLDENDDVRKNNIHPLIHYIKYGINEGRSAKPLIPFKKQNKFSLFNNDYNPNFFKHWDDFIVDYPTEDFNKNVSVAVLLKSGDGNFLPTAYIRLIIPLYHLCLEKNAQFYLFYGSDIEKLKQEITSVNKKLFDIIITQRDCIDFETATSLVNSSKKYGTKLIYELDDDLLGIDKNHPNYHEFVPMKKSIQFLIENADVVTVSTNNLKEKISNLNSNIFVIRNFLNKLLGTSIKSVNNSNVIKIGYMGSFTHENDIKLIENVIENVKLYFSTKKEIVEFELIGVTKNKINHCKTIEIPNNCRIYPNFIRWIKEVVDWDIALAPLENNQINYSKSEIKYVEYASLGIPGIYSDVGAYSEVIEDSYNGLLINNNSIEDWENAIIDLIENSTLREDIVNNSKQDIEKNYSIEKMIRSWSEVFESLLDDKKRLLFNESNPIPLFTNHSFFNEYNIIKKSQLLDENEYFSNYPDVKVNNFDPIYHYLTMGVFEGCNPSKNFNTNEYISKYDIDPYEINPLVHYIENNVLKFNFKEFSIKNIGDICDNIGNQISIIVPIYNAYEDTKRCIESVLINSTKKYELVLINDCSTDERIDKLLSGYENYPTIRIINNSENKGFVGTVNVGLKNTHGDVILLNSDTIVTPKWLEKLSIAAYSNEFIGTVTPFSNNAGAFSVPNIGVENFIPNDLELNSMSNIVEKVSNHEYMSVPTGNGFCLYIKREVIDSVGYFDEETFGRGYGEENDFCMRAIEKGWINIIDDSTYIFHNKGSSFSDERENLIKEHRKLLDEKHPSYTSEVRKFVNSDKLKIMQDNIRFGINNFKVGKYDKKRILYVIHSNSGGTPKTNEDLMKQVEKDFDCYLLFAHTNVMILYHFLNGEQIKLKEWSFDSRWWAEKFYNKEYRKIYFEVLNNLNIDIVHIRHLIHHTFDLPIIAKLLNIPVVLSFHDFYMVCPSFTLLDENFNYCAGICNNNHVNCQVPSTGITQQPIMKDFVKLWRKNVSELFEFIDCFITTAPFVKNVFMNIYPSSFENNFHIIEHGRDFQKITQTLFEVPSNDKPMKILFIGNVLRHKGSKIIKDLYELDQSNQIEFHFLGSTDESLNGIGIHHGKYRREDLVKHVAKIQPSFIGIFSIWPETFCHTLTESWSCKIPVLATKIGVIEDRVKINNGGLFIDYTDIFKSYEEIINIKNNPKKYSEIQKNVEKILFKSEEEMGKDYIQIYENLLCLTR